MKKLLSLLPVSVILATMLSSCDSPAPPVQRPLHLGAPMSVIDTGDSDLRFVDREAGSIIGSGYDHTWPYSPRSTAYYFSGPLEDGGHYHNGTYYPSNYHYVNSGSASAPVTSRKYK